MPRFVSVRLSLATPVLVVLMLATTPAAGNAQGFISPLLGFDFGGDSGCPEISTCEDKNLNIGIAVGSLGSVLGSEFEFGWARDFFGEIPNASSSVLTLMGNVMLAPRFGPAQPYGLIGLGLIKSNVEFSAPALLETSNNHFGWDVGGGLIIFFGENVGIRGDLRYYHAFQDLEILGIGLGDTKLDFGRAAAGLVLRF